MTSKSSPALVEASGRDYAEWFDLLDGWGAPGRPYAEIADWLARQGLGSWWTQKLIIEYEQHRGIRRAGARPDGSYTAGASKTITATSEQVFEAFTDPGVRESWLPSPVLTERTSTPSRSARFDLDGGPGRLQLTVVTGTSGKVTVAVEQSCLDDPDTVEPTKQAWRRRLGILKAVLEARSS